MPKRLKGCRRIIYNLFDMETNTKEVTKGRLSWVIPILEIIVIIVYLAIGYNGIQESVAASDFEGIFNSVKTAIWFLVIVTIIITILCFLPIFKSKLTVRIGVWNVIWLILTLYGLFS